MQGIRVGPGKGLSCEISCEAASHCRSHGVGRCNARTVACTLLFVDISNPIRDNYDSVADEYARRIADELQHKPLDRQLLARFAAETAGHGRICDMGCGPGHVARALHEADANVFGLDLSPGMLDQARRLNPGIHFQLGNMLALDLPDHSLAGIVAFYAIVNLPAAVLPTAFGEMHRVLEPGGLLLLASHIGDEVRHTTTFLDRPFALDFFFWPPAVMRPLLEDAGLRVEEIVERDPYPEYEFQTRRAYYFARKPLTPTG
jgi:ubiquinone/menaquinone biosynthesis C-methylase UbiE